MVHDLFDIYDVEQTKYTAVVIDLHCKVRFLIRQIVCVCLFFFFFVEADQDEQRHFFFSSGYEWNVLCCLVELKGNQSTSSRR